MMNKQKKKEENIRMQSKLYIKNILGLLVCISATFLAQHQCQSAIQCSSRLCLVVILLLNARFFYCYIRQLALETQVICPSILKSEFTAAINFKLLLANSFFLKRHYKVGLPLKRSNKERIERVANSGERVNANIRSAAQSECCQIRLTSWVKYNRLKIGLVTRISQLSNL